MRSMFLVGELTLVATACRGGSTTGAGSSPQPTSSVTNGGPAHAVLPGFLRRGEVLRDPYVGGIATTKSLGEPGGMPALSSNDAWSR